jgi:hypothetical protein
VSRSARRRDVEQVVEQVVEHVDDTDAQPVDSTSSPAASWLA